MPRKATAMNETVYILLPVHNRREITERFITCLNAQTYTRHHLILIDDGSTDGTANMVRERIPSLTVITGMGDWWWGGALHEGYQWLRKARPSLNDIVLIINDDTEFDDRFLDEAVSFLRGLEKTFLLAQCFDKRDGAFIDAGVHVDWKNFTFERPSPRRPVNCMSTRGLFFRVGDFFAVGGFHPLLLPHYFSDYEFTIRAHRRGFALLSDPRIRIRLDQSTTGHHHLGDKAIAETLSAIFSLKSTINPLAMAVFVALACPGQWKLTALFRILVRCLSRGWALLMRRPPVS
jgi:GT2 family glycosyltransferase